MSNYNVKAGDKVRITDVHPSDAWYDLKAQIIGQVTTVEDTGGEGPSPEEGWVPVNVTGISVTQDGETDFARISTVSKRR